MENGRNIKRDECENGEDKPGYGIAIKIKKLAIEMLYSSVGN